MTTRYYSSIAQDTTISTPILAGTTTVAVSSTTGWPLSYPFSLALDYGTALEEIVDVTSVSGLTATITRGVDSTIPVAHGAGAIVRHVIIARDIRDSNTHINTTSGAGAHGILDVQGYTTTVTAAGTTTLTSASTSAQYFTGTMTQTVVLPVTSTLALGQKFVITNTSQGAVTVQSSGGNAIAVVPADSSNGASTIIFTCISLSGTGISSWSASISGFGSQTGVGDRVVLQNSPLIIAPTISSIVNTGTLTLPTSNDTLVGRATIDTLTNKDLSSSTNTLPPIKDKGGQVFNVMAYGAKGDGVTNDTVAINAAIAAAVAAKGGVVYFPQGRYITTATLVINGHSITLQGASIGAGPGDYGGGIVSGSTIVGTIGTTTISAGNYGWPTVRDLNIVLPTVATSATVAIDFNQPFNPKIINVQIVNYSTGIHLQKTTDTYIERAFIKGALIQVATVVGIDVDSSSGIQNQSVYIRDCISTPTASGGNISYAYYLHGNRISDCTFDTCEADFTTYGFYIDGTGVNAGYGGDIHLVNCIADNCVSNGFLIQACTVDSVITIVGGWVAGPGFGIYVSGSSSGVTIANMQIYNGTQGIYFQGGNGNKALGNSLFYQSGNGIVVDNCTNTIVANNSVKSGGAMGAAYNFISGASYAICSGNVAFGAAATITYGVQISATSTNINVSDNLLISSAIVSTPVTIAAGATKIIVSHNPGYNPVGSAVPGTAFVIGATTVAATNNTGVDGTLYVTAAGTVTAVSVNGVAVSGTVSVGDSYRIAAGGTLTMTYTVAPAIVFVGD